MTHRLTPRKIEALRVRYGLDTGVPQTYREVGTYLGVSATRGRTLILDAHDALGVPLGPSLAQTIAHVKDALDAQPAVTEE